MFIDISGPIKDFNAVCVKIEKLEEDYRVLIDLQIERRDFVDESLLSERNSSLLL